MIKYIQNELSDIPSRIDRVQHIAAGEIIRLRGFENLDNDQTRPYDMVLSELNDIQRKLKKVFEEEKS